MHHALTLACAPWQESTGASVLETLKSGSCLSFPSPPPARLCPAEGSSLPATQLQDQSRHHPKASLPPWLAGCLPLVMQVPGGQAQPPPSPAAAQGHSFPPSSFSRSWGFPGCPKGSGPWLGTRRKSCSPAATRSERAAHLQERDKQRLELRRRKATAAALSAPRTLPGRAIPGRQMLSALHPWTGRAFSAPGAPPHRSCQPFMAFVKRRLAPSPEKELPVCSILPGLQPTFPPSHWAVA